MIESTVVILRTFPVIRACVPLHGVGAKSSGVPATATGSLPQKSTTTLVSAQTLNPKQPSSKSCQLVGIRDKGYR